MLKTCVTVFLTNAKRLFKLRYGQLQVQSLSRGQLESLNLDKFLTVFKILPCYDVLIT